MFWSFPFFFIGHFYCRDSSKYVRFFLINTCFSSGAAQIYLVQSKSWFLEVFKKFPHRSQVIFFQPFWCRPCTRTRTVVFSTGRTDHVGTCLRIVSQSRAVPQCCPDVLVFSWVEVVSIPVGIHFRRNLRKFGALTCERACALMPRRWLLLRYLVIWRLYPEKL